MATRQLALENPVVDAPALPAGNPCFECGGRCCSFKSLNICWQGIEDADLPLDDEEAARATVHQGNPETLIRETGELIDMDWYVDRGGEYASLVFDCQHKTDDGLCGVYDDRPEMCAAFKCSVLRGRQSLPEFESNHGRDGDVDTSEFVDVTESVVDEILTLTDAEPPERFAYLAE